MSSNQQNQNKSQSQQSHQNQSQPKATINMGDNTQSPIQLQQTPPVTVEVKEKPEAERLYNVRIRKDVKSMRYGNETLSFMKGKEVPVGWALRNHLEEKGII